MSPVQASVVIPARDAAATIDDQLAALCGQDAGFEWEVIVAESGSRDATAEKARAWTGALANLRVVDAADDRGCAHARNVGAAASQSDLILFCDADDIVAPGWIAAMVDALQHHDIVSGPLDRTTLNDPKQYAWLTGHELHPSDLPVAYGNRPFVPGGNMGIRRPVLEALGGFDVRLKAAEDIDLSWRALDARYRLGWAPGATLHYRLRPAPWRLLLQRLRNGTAEPLLYRLYRDRGMQRDAPSMMPAVYAGLVGGLPGALASSDTRWEWAYRAGGRAGRLVGSVRHRTLFL